MTNGILTRPDASHEATANGLFSATPRPRSVRLLVAALLLAMVEAGLVLAAPQVAPLLKLGAAGILVLSMLVIVLGGCHERRQREARR